MKYPAEVYTPEEVDAVLRATNRGSTGLMHRALITTMYRTGLRIGEALALKPKDVDLAAGRMTVLHGKGDKRRVLGLPQEAVTALQLWMERRYLLFGRAPEQTIFCTLAGRRPLGQGVRELFSHLGKRAGIGKRFHPHGLRHSFAVRMAQRPDVPVRQIQEMLGHSSLATTDVYLRHLSPEDVVATMQAG